MQGVVRPKFCMLGKLSCRVALKLHVSFLPHKSFLLYGIHNISTEIKIDDHYLLTDIIQASGDQDLLTPNTRINTCRIPIGAYKEPTRP